jgi:hypothetical protein
MPKNIYESGELEQVGTIKDFLIVQKEGTRKVQRTIQLYNLDVIISVAPAVLKSGNILMYVNSGCHVKTR